MSVRHRRVSADSPKRRCGAAAVEFAFVVPIVFLFVFGLVEFGRLVMVQQSLTNSAREGCRKAVLATTTSKQDVEAVARSYLDASIPDHLNKVKVYITPISFTDTGTAITVAVEVKSSDVSWLSGNFLGFLGDPVLSGRAIQERE